MSISDITKEAVIEAIAEFDRKGLENTLTEYGFHEAKRYYLVHNRKYYPSKAVLGIAHKYARPDLGPLSPEDFSGGRDTVQRKLEQLGFQLVVSDLAQSISLTLERGQVYRREEVQNLLGGQRYGGISTPQASNYILLFSSESGKEHGYTDGWQDEGVYYYSGEGQVGDMHFNKGNAAIRDHIKNGKELLLFEEVAPGYHRFVDQMIYTGYHFEVRPDTKGVDRQAIIFELAPQSQFDQSEEIIETQQELEGLPLEKLREKALSTATSAVTAKERKGHVYLRSAAIRLYALERAKGICGGCGNPAPFITSDGRPFLEVHHIRQVADGGPDHPEWVIAVCPNCHRKAHYAKNKYEFNEHLKFKASEQETARM